MLQAVGFGEKNFGNAQLGDKRRTKRLVSLVEQLCLRPGGSLPQKLRSPKDLKSFYRLMDADEVTHKAILDPHRDVTMERIEELNKAVLILHDTTELDYTTHKSLKELGQIGNGKNRGYLAHNSLAIEPESGEVLGLTNQILHRRAVVSKSETHSQRRKRTDRESLLWPEGTKPLPSNWNLIDVCDRGADTFEFLQHEVQSGRRFVIRSSHDRCIKVGHDAPEDCKSTKLRAHLRSLPEAGTWKLNVTASVKQTTVKGKKKTVKRRARQAKMAVSYAPIQLMPTESVGMKRGALKIWAVRVWELNPPKGEERLEWILFTNEPVNDFEDAYRVVGWYECRWIIEEYHKGMKTGCKIESIQFTSESRLKPAIAVLSTIALTLLKIREAARRPDAKERRAAEVVGVEYVEMLSLWRHNRIKSDWSVHDFYYALARLGGHQNRKGDHPPGWQVIWEGWKELLPMVNGYIAGKSKRKNCG